MFSLLLLILGVYKASREKIEKQFTRCIIQVVNILSITFDFLVSEEKTYLEANTFRMNPSFSVKLFLTFSHPNVENSVTCMLK